MIRPIGKLIMLVACVIGSRENHDPITNRRPLKCWHSRQLATTKSETFLTLKMASLPGRIFVIFVLFFAYALAISHVDLAETSAITPFVIMGNFIIALHFAATAE